MNNNIEHYKELFSKKMNLYFENNDWENAKVLIENEIIKFPNEYFLITSLSKVYYNLKSFDKSLKLAKEAFEIEPNDVLVLYDYACVLAAHNKNEKALKYWNIILNKNINDIAYGQFGEGLKWAKSIINDSRFRKSLCLIEVGELKEAKQLIVKHLKDRKRGIYSDFTKKQILKKKDELDSIFK